MAQLRRQHQFQPTTGLYSTQQVFAFARLSEVSTGLSDFLVVINVAGEEVELGLGDLLLQMGLGTEGEVVIRSSGNTAFGNNLFCFFYILSFIFMTGFGNVGNYVGSIINVTNMKLQGFEALVLRML